MNKKTLAALGAAVVLCVAAFGSVLLYKVFRGRGGNEAEVLPAGAFVAARLDLERVRRWSAWASLRRMVQGDGSDAGPRVGRMQGEWQGFVSRCGFDPLDRLDRIVGAGDRAVLEGRSQNDWLVHASGRFTRAELQRCVEQVLQRERGRLEPSQVQGRPVFTALSAGESAGPQQVQLHLREGTGMAAPTAFMARALDMLYGDAPRLGREQSVGRMYARLAGESVLAVVVDVAAVRTRNAQTTQELVDDLVRANPGIPELTLARQVVTGGLGVRTENGGVIATLRAQMENANQGQAFTAAVRALVQARRPDALEGIAGIQSMTRLSRMLPGQNLDGEWEAIDAAFAAVRAVLESGVRVEQEQDTAVVTLTVNAAQATAIEQGVRAVQRVVGARGDQRRDPGPSPGLLERPSMPSL